MSDEKDVDGCTVADETLIGYCGLYCGDCFAHKQTIPDLAKQLRAELRHSKYDRFAAHICKMNFAKALEKYDECYEALGLMVKFRCGKGCRSGGGNPFCGVRKCCLSKKFDGCWECTEFETCKWLEPNEVHGDASRKNLKRLKKSGKKAFVEGKRDW